MTENTLHKLALVTGAATRLGKAIALGLAQKGYAIGLHYHRSEAAAQQTAAEIQQLGMPVLLLPADLSKESQVKALFRSVEESPFVLEVLVNSAAEMHRADLLELSVKEWDQTMALNLRAPWLCARYAARLMLKDGVIINISDSGTRKVWVGYPSYLISKVALEALTRQLARRLGPRIRVNAIAPGLMLPADNFPQQEWHRLVSRIPMQQAGRVEELVKAVLFLVESLYITGEVLVVDGGYALT
jgi:NAD(P)-dependent dehydrogenase (short-subunit alcohol dehydrogenase family)